MLGLAELRVARILEWTERINALVDRQEWQEALVLALDHYEASLSSLDVRHPLRVEGTASLEKLLLRYTGLAFKKESGLGAVNHFQETGGVCIDFCVSIGRTDLLFGRIFDTFKEAKQEAVFLELLEPYILKDKVTHELHCVSCKHLTNLVTVD